jgi:hypothetical protein
VGGTGNCSTEAGGVGLFFCAKLLNANKIEKKMVSREMCIMIYDDIYFEYVFVKLSKYESH